VSVVEQVKVKVNPTPDLEPAVLVHLVEKPKERARGDTVVVDKQQLEEVMKQVVRK
jgi:hypothetical protein